MNRNLEKAFDSIGQSESFDLLQLRIISRINHEQVKRANIKVFTAWVTGGASLVALFPVFLNMFGRLQDSGFLNYLALFFTDTSVVATYWKEFSLSLVEAVPFFELTLVLFLVMSLFVSLKFALKDFRRIGLSANLV